MSYNRWIASQSPKIKHYPLDLAVQCFDSLQWTLYGSTRCSNRLILSVTIGFIAFSLSVNFTRDVRNVFATKFNSISKQRVFWFHDFFCHLNHGNVCLKQRPSDLWTIILSLVKTLHIQHRDITIPLFLLKKFPVGFSMHVFEICSHWSNISTFRK